ncbi:unnamed protein product, partial [Durusdinium trenchii]
MVFLPPAPFTGRVVITRRWGVSSEEQRGAARSLEPAASRQGQASVLGDSKGTDDPRASAAAEVTA